MCGRYSNAKDLSELMKLVDSVMRVAFFGPRYNIAPTQMAPVIFMENKKPAMKLMRWGLIPSWAKDETTGNALINARAETLNTRQAFRQAFQQRRCLVPADGFYEWQEREGKRQPFRIMLKSGEPFCFAGLWERWIKPPSSGQPDTDLEEAPPSQTVESFTIITTQANEDDCPVASSNAGHRATGALSLVVGKQTRQRIVSISVKQPAARTVENLSGQQSRQQPEDR